MVATADEYETKFRHVALYTNLKNVSTSFEYLLKNLTAKGGLKLDGKTLTPAVIETMRKETGWISVFTKKVSLTKAKDSAEFFNNLSRLAADPVLMQSEDAYWARAFLMTCLARNLTVHLHPIDDWFYGELFGEMLDAVIYAVLYVWQVAKREKWV